MRENWHVLILVLLKAIAPAIFDAVQNPGLEYGPYHYFKYAKNAMACLSAAHWEIVKKYFINNSYFAHPENLLFGLFICPLSSQEVKQKALDLIMQFRRVFSKSKRKTVRKFIKPNGKELNFGANTLFDLLNWDVIAKSKKTPPPIFQYLSDSEVESLMLPENHHLFAQLLCHSQV